MRVSVSVEFLTNDATVVLLAAVLSVISMYFMRNIHAATLQGLLVHTQIESGGGT